MKQESVSQNRGIMANIKSKDINNLSDWDAKELRKLRITIKNRISALEVNDKKQPQQSHILYNFGIEECKTLLQKVQKAERDLAKA